MADVTVSVAEAKRTLSDLLGRVSYGGARVLITKRSRPIALIVPAQGSMAEQSLADVKGWLDDNDPFFSALEKIEQDRTRHVPRHLRETGPGYGRKKQVRKTKARP